MKKIILFLIAVIFSVKFYAQEQLKDNSKTDIPEMEAKAQSAKLRSVLTLVTNNILLHQILYGCLLCLIHYRALTFC